MSFNLSWKTIGIIALIVFTLLVARQIISWLIYRDARTLIHQIQQTIAEEDKAIRQSQQQMTERAKQFDNAVDAHIQSTDERIKATGKVFQAAWEELDKKRKAQPPIRRLEDFHKDVDKLMQQNMNQSPLPPSDKPATAQSH